MRNAMRTKAKCVECGRVFDLTDENDAAEWAYGHDCEEPVAGYTVAVNDTVVATVRKVNL
jgi:hypothetical protein